MARGKVPRDSNTVEPDDEEEEVKRTFYHSFHVVQVPFPSFSNSQVIKMQRILQVSQKKKSMSNKFKQEHFFQTGLAKSGCLNEESMFLQFHKLQGK